MGGSCYDSELLFVMINQKKKKELSNLRRFFRLFLEMLLSTKNQTKTRKEDPAWFFSTMTPMQNVST